VLKTAELLQKIDLFTDLIVAQADIMESY